MMKKKRRVPAAPKGNRSQHKNGEPYPDNDPEWAQLEERYSQINDDMRKLAELIPTNLQSE